MLKYPFLLSKDKEKPEGKAGEATPTERKVCYRIYSAVYIG